MQLVEPKYYRFSSEHHWAAGVTDQLEISNAGLKAPTLMSVETMARTGAMDSTTSLAPDPCDSIYWVREVSFELFRWFESGVYEVGRLSGINGEKWETAGLAIGTNRIWLLLRSKNDGTSTTLFRYFSDTLQQLVNIDVDRQILDLAEDSQDGVWLLLGGDSKPAELLHLDHTGKRLMRIALETVVLQGQIDMIKGGEQMIVLDIDPQTDSCAEALAWRIWNIDICDGENKILFSLPSRDPVCNRDIPVFKPDLLALDQNDHIHLLDAQDGSLWNLNTTGEVIARLPGMIPAEWRPVKALVANRGLIVSGAMGIGKINLQYSAHPTALQSAPTYITPTLVSPDGMQSGWMRVDLGVDFEAGTAVEISVASTKDEKLIKEIGDLLGNKDLSTITRLHRINSRLPWCDERTEVYPGGDWPRGRPLRYPLHEIEDTHLWLRIRVYSTDGAKAPTINSMRVLYPDISYNKYLPAVYQEDEYSSRFLRRLLAVFEGLFGDLDEQLGELPGRIDPRTAPDDWLPYLLSWLGLPVATELDPIAQRSLLLQTPALLRDRGTRSALERLLELLVGNANDFAVTDNGEGPAPWTLPDKQGSGYAPRLGCDTLVFVQQQPGFRPGFSACLGSQPLGYTTLDPLQLFTRSGGLITIRIAASITGREKLEPLIRRYLPYFIPAHCRYVLRFVSQTELGKTPRLDSKLLLQSEPSPSLGEGTRIGRMRLKAEKGAGIDLGHAAFTNDGPYLT